MNEKRNVQGEFHHVYEELRRDRERFFSFYVCQLKHLICYCTIQINKGGDKLKQNLKREVLYLHM